VSASAALVALVCPIVVDDFNATDERTRAWKLEKLRDDEGKIRGTARALARGANNGIVTRKCDGNADAW